MKYAIIIYKSCLFLVVALNVFSAQAQIPGIEWGKVFWGEINRSNAISITNNGKIIIAGSLSDTTDLNPGTGTYIVIPPVNTDYYYICELNANGLFQWAITLPHASQVEEVDLVLDANSNILITGSFKASGDFNPGPSTCNLYCEGGNDVFLIKLDQTGNLLWAHSFGSTGDETGSSLNVDHQGNIILAGTFSGTIDFDPGPGVHSMTSANLEDIYVCKFDPAGNHIWSRQFKGNKNERVVHTAIDNNDNIGLTGPFSGTIDFDPGIDTFSLSSQNSDPDIFFCKLDSDGDFISAIKISGYESDSGEDLVFDSNNNVLITGYFRGTVDFDPGPSTHYLSGIYWDVYILKLDSLNNFIWAKSFGGNHQETVHSIKLDIDESIYTIGEFIGDVDFDPDTGVFEVNNFYQGEDIYVLKLDDNGQFQWVMQLGADSLEYGSDLAITNSGILYVTGFFWGQPDLDPGPGTFQIDGWNHFNTFIAKYTSEISSVSWHTQDELWQIFPNPVDERINIIPPVNVQNATGEISDIYGHVVQSFILNGSVEQIVNLQIDKGVYFLVIKSPFNSPEIRKIIKN
jgi:hypothetical protein